MAEARELFGLAKLVFEPISLGDVLGNAENAGDVRIGKKVAPMCFNMEPAAIRVRQADDFQKFGVGHPGAFLDLAGHPFAVVRMDEIGNLPPAQRPFLSSESLAHCRALIGDDTFAIDDRKNAARVFDEGAVEVRTGGRTGTVRTRCV